MVQDAYEGFLAWSEDAKAGAWEVPARAPRNYDADAGSNQPRILYPDRRFAGLPRVCALALGSP